MSTSLLASGSVTVSFIPVTLDVTSTISIRMPHHSMTSAYHLGPEVVRIAFAGQRLLPSLWGLFTHFSKALQEG